MSLENEKMIAGLRNLWSRLEQLEAENKRLRNLVAYFETETKSLKTRTTKLEPEIEEA